MLNKQFSRRNIQLIYLLTDIMSSIIVWLCFLIFRWMVYEGRVFGVDEILIPAFNFYPPLFLYPLGCVLIYYLSGYYMRPLYKSLAHELALTTLCAIIISFVAFFIIIINDQVESYQRYLYSLLALFALQLVISYLPRLAITLAIRRRAKEGYLARNVIIIGEGEKAEILAKQLQTQHTEYAKITLLSEQELFTTLDNNSNIDADMIILSASADFNEDKIYTLVNKLYPLGIEICYTPRQIDMLIGSAHISSLTANPIVSITDCHIPDWQLCVKRVFDVALSISGLIILSPLLLIIALLIKLTSQGPIIYRQERIGHYGRKFNILKFRTMVEHAEKGVPQLSAKNDDRITPLGKWLRRYRLDELPQLLNVVKGDMSIVGPRPEREYFVNQIMQRAPYYCLIYQIRPGLTSWGPIKVGYTDTIDKMIERTNYDIVYMKNMSLWLDVKIMFYTVAVIFNGRGQ